MTAGNLPDPAFHCSQKHRGGVPGRPDDTPPWSPARVAPKLLVLPARTRMSFIVYLGKMLEIKVRVNLGCTYIRMAKHFLNGTQVAG